jgi:xanthine dehydrogenase YagR molybdenum-binding subunit
MSYIGAPISRIDGHAKVTGAAKYAAEINVAGLAHGSVVASRIAKGRILHIDASDALNVAGVIDVLTHENRPAMARTDGGYADDVAPEGSPFRPLYNNRVLFSRQPIALIVAEEPEVARFAASLVRVDYAEDDHVTDLFHRRDQAVARLKGNFGPPKARGSVEAGLAAAAIRHAGEYYVPVETHNPMELYASTAIWDGNGKLTIHDKTQGVQNVHRYVCGVFGMKPEDVRVLSAYVGGAFGSGLRPQYQVVLAVLAARAGAFGSGRSDARTNV